MAIQAAVGQASALDGRDAGINAAHNALQDADGKQASIGFVFVSHEYDMQAVLIGVSSQLGKTPLIGLSTSGEISLHGNTNRSVLVALLSGENIQAKADWVKIMKKSNAEAIEKLVFELDMGNSSDAALMLVTDGLITSDETTYRGLLSRVGTVFGCAAGGKLPRGETSQIGGVKSGIGGVAGAFIQGVSVGIGTAHGWRPVGQSFDINIDRDHWVHSLDGIPPSESYAGIFGHPASDWGLPPLNTLVRQYPLGLLRDNGAPLQVRAPLWMEENGSLRMNIKIEDGSVGQLLVGSRENCIEAARSAAKEALSALGGAKPVLALVFADVSWQKLLEGNPGSDIQALREILGEDVLIAGGYTAGQIARDTYSGQVEMLNQHIEIVLFGEQ